MLFLSLFETLRVHLLEFNIMCGEPHEWRLEERFQAKIGTDEEYGERTAPTFPGYAKGWSS